MKTYLIQRGTFENRDFKKGIDSIVLFDYMGSAEFEFGALPESLGRIRKNITEYVYLQVSIKGKPITVFCKESQKPEIENYLNELAEGKMQLKSYSDFNSYIKPTYSKNRTDFWWDIENDVMFWKNDLLFENKFRKLIETKPQTQQ